MDIFFQNIFNKKLIISIVSYYQNQTFIKQLLKCILSNKKIIIEIDHRNTKLFVHLSRSYLMLNFFMLDFLMDTIVRNRSNENGTTQEALAFN